jgi:hypothetical protein
LYIVPTSAKEEDFVTVAPFKIADARLIAAAPDLLEALNEIPLEHDHKYPHLRACWKCIAQAAIAKATGSDQ